MKSRSTNWCNAGKSYVWLRNNKTIMPCCALSTAESDPLQFKLDDNVNFVDVMNSNDFMKAIKPLEKSPLAQNRCRQCLTDEDHSIKNKINKHANTVSVGARGKIIKDPFYLKIDLSNKCNLKCIMCNSRRSTGWVKDEQRLFEAGMINKNDIASYDKLPDKWWKVNDDKWWKNVNQIEISGGEPFYEPMLIEFFEFLLSIGKSNTNITIITNLTLYNKDIENILKKFTNVKLFCSVDAWQEDVYQYSRGGIYTLDVIKENIIKLSNIVSWLSIIDTVHCTTYDQSILGKKWVSDQNVKNVSHNINYVYTPRHLDARSVIPDSMLKTNLDIKIPKSGFKKETNLQLKFYNWINALDKIRGTSVLSIRPEFESWFREMESWEK